MRTQTCGEIEIEDLLGHPEDVMEELRSGLSDGTRMVPDPKRTGFYEVQCEQLTYYVHVMPGSGKVLLLAAWPTA
jgi:5,10-methenyltetrahydromethanopterin hydrogenase